MYTSVGSRTREIATLRVLGFEPLSIYLSFLIEAIVLAFHWRHIGLPFSLPLNGLATGTFNWASFAEVAFEFQITFGLIVGRDGLFLGYGDDRWVIAGQDGSANEVVGRVAGELINDQTFRVKATPALKAFLRRQAIWLRHKFARSVRFQTRATSARSHPRK